MPEMPRPWNIVPGAVPGAGGQGDVFPVRRPDDDRRYALKRLKNPARAGRFAREVHLMDHLNRDGLPCVPPVVEQGQDARRRYYFVMPWYDGGSLDAAVEDGRFRADPAAGLRVLIRLAHAIDLVHRAGVAHRDIKPGNVLLDGEQLLLVDFGLALDPEDATRLTGTEEAVGSRLYVAPENESGINENVEQKPADFYAFAKMAWALLAGRKPPGREDQLSGRWRIEALTGVNRLAPLNGLFVDLLNSDPRARLDSWAVVEHELRAALAGFDTATQDVSLALDPHERARELARQLAGSEAAAAARALQQRRERESAQLTEIRTAMMRGLFTHEAAFAELTAQTGGQFRVVVSSGGGPSLRQAAQFGMLRAAGAESVPSSTSNDPTLDHGNTALLSMSNPLDTFRGGGLFGVHCAAFG
jgi:serine/threonine protein kinase